MQRGSLKTDCQTRGALDTSPARPSTLCLSSRLPHAGSFPERLSGTCPSILADFSKYAGALIPEGTSLLLSGWASAKAPSQFGVSLSSGLSPYKTVISWHVGNVPNAS